MTESFFQHEGFQREFWQAFPGPVTFQMEKVSSPVVPVKKFWTSSRFETDEPVHPERMSFLVAELCQWLRSEIETTFTPQAHPGARLYSPRGLVVEQTGNAVSVEIELGLVPAANLAGLRLVQDRLTTNQMRDSEKLELAQAMIAAVIADRESLIAQLGGTP